MNYPRTIKDSDNINKDFFLKDAIGSLGRNTVYLDLLFDSFINTIEEEEMFSSKSKFEIFEYVLDVYINELGITFPPKILSFLKKIYNIKLKE